MGDAESSAETACWRRRMAVQLMAQLPDNREDALAILSYAKDVLDFIYPASRAARLTLVPPVEQPLDKNRGQT